MPTPSPFRPPLPYRLLILLAACLVPRASRPAFRRRQDQSLFDWWILSQRGELFTHPARLLRAAFLDAFTTRIPLDALARFVRGPAFYLATASSLVLLLALLTRGFAYTRHLLRLAALLLPAPPDLRSDVLVGHTFILAVSLTAAVAMLAIRRPPSYSATFRYWAFFALQCALVLTLVPIAWIESAAAFRACFPHHEGMRAFGTLILTLAYLPSLAAALAWVLADQRARCPVCLRRLEYPVSLGSWSSVFDPSSTELLCDLGHGALLLPADAATPSRWTRLDDSWQNLFTHSGA